MRNCIFGVLAILILSSCSNTIEHTRQDKDVSLDANSGYLLMAVDLNRGVEAIEIDGPKDFELTKDDLQKQTNFFLIPLPQGNYKIERVRLNRYWRLDFDEDIWEFQVRPGVISYVGHLNLRSKGGFFSVFMYTDLQNNSSQARAFMETSFPNILSSRKLKYAGPGEDSFLDFAETLPQQGAEE